jgi:hypothetical protein
VTVTNPLNPLAQIRPANVLAFLDVETSSTDPRTGDLWELAMILEPLRADEGQVFSIELVWQFPISLVHADPRSLEINGYWDRCYFAQPGNAGATDLVRVVGHCQPGLTPRQCPGVVVATEIARVLRGAWLVAANVAFDDAFITKMLRRYDVCRTADYHMVEVESFAAGAAGLQPPWKLDTAAAAVGVYPAGFERHTALGVPAREVGDTDGPASGSLLLSSPSLNLRTAHSTT